MSTHLRRGSVSALLTAGAATLLLFLLLALVSSQQVQASPMTQAGPTSSLRLQWSLVTGVLSLTEQSARASGQVAVNVRQNGTSYYLDLTLPAGTFFAATSTARRQQPVL